MTKDRLALAVSIATALVWFSFQQRARGASRLLPFQGRITDSQGQGVADGERTIQFKLYNALVGGQAVWSGEVQKLSVNGGLVSTILGSKVTLGGVDFNQDLYLELTIDANGDSQITISDPPLLPRQAVFPSVFALEAANSRKLANHDWSALFAGEGATNPPTGKISGNRILNRSITSEQLEVGIIDERFIKKGSVGSDQIAPGAVTSTQISAGAITANSLVKEVAEALVPPGSIMPFGGPAENVPIGWLLCNGRVINSVLEPQFSRLWNAIGTAWGGDGPQGFNLPDLRGLFIRGVDRDLNGQVSGQDSDATSRVSIKAGGNSGNEVGSYQGSEFLAHFHGTAINTPNNQGVDLFGTGVLDSSTLPRPGALMFGGGAGIGFAQNSQRVGGNETRPKNASVNYIIKY